MNNFTENEFMGTNTPNVVIELIKDSGYVTVQYCGKWHGADVYYPKADQDMSWGFPSYIIEKGGQARFATFHETTSIIAELFNPRFKQRMLF